MNPNQNPWAVKHQLETVTITLNLLPGSQVDLSATGRSSGKRSALWSYSEHFGPANSSLAPHDAAAHLLLVCLQDKPRCLEDLERSLRGGAMWDEVELPWT